MNSLGPEDVVGIEASIFVVPIEPTHKLKIFAILEEYFLASIFFMDKVRINVLR